MDTAIIEMTSTASIAIALFGMVFCLMQTTHVRVNRSLAAFLAAVAVNNLPDAFNRFAAGMDPNHLELVDLVIWFPSTLCLAPLFWVYVYTLTSPAARLPQHLTRHFMLPLLAALCGLIVVAAPRDVLQLLSGQSDLPFSGESLALVLVIATLQLAVFPQIGIYLFLIVRRMIRFRVMLRDVYASTEQHELRWIVAIGGLGAIFWGVAVALLLVQLRHAQPQITTALLGLGGAASVALVGTIVLWGIRQRPPLVPDTKEGEPLDMPQAERQAPRGSKYEKSALSAEASTRIANKLRAAMERDSLHRDPNLSLWALARHVGASPNYISQTLNEVIGESFFDFVNGYRIAEAKTLLSTTDTSVLAITYDVGFNTRSSFYNAFKRVVGQTPTGYRKSMSFPVGMDDIAS